MHSVRMPGLQAAYPITSVCVAIASMSPLACQWRIDGGQLTGLGRGSRVPQKEETMKSRFSTNLRALRTKKKLTQHGLGKMVGVPSTTISHLENGRANPRSYISKLEKALGERITYDPADVARRNHRMNGNRASSLPIRAAGARLALATPVIEKAETRVYKVQRVRMGDSALQIRGTDFEVEVETHEVGKP